MTKVKVRINVKVNNGRATVWVHKGAVTTQKTIRLK